MKVPPQPRVSALLRIVAGTCTVLWLVGMAACGMERVYNCAGPDEACADKASPMHEHDAVTPHEDGHSHDTEHHDDAETPEQATALRHHHDSAAQHEHGRHAKKGCDEKACCSTMMALLPTAIPAVTANSISQRVFFVCLLNAGPEPGLAAPYCEAARQAKARERVSLPEVCLGPAHRSHAPPSLT